MTPDTLAIELFCRLASLSNSLSRASISSSSSLSCGRAIPADLARHRPNHTARMQCDSLPLSRESGAPMGSTHTHATGTQTSRQVHSLRGCSSELATSDARAWRGLGEQRRRGSVDLMRGSEAANNNDHDAAAARGRDMTSADMTSRISIGIQTSWMVGQPSHPDTPDRDRHVWTPEVRLTRSEDLRDLRDLAPSLASFACCCCRSHHSLSLSSRTLIPLPPWIAAIPTEPS